MSQGWTVENVATFPLFIINAAIQILNPIGLENTQEDDPQLHGFAEIGIQGFAA